MISVHIYIYKKIKTTREIQTNSLATQEDTNETKMQL
jgi:hypothetical protein